MSNARKLYGVKPEPSQDFSLKVSGLMVAQILKSEDSNDWIMVYAPRFNGDFNVEKSKKFASPLEAVAYYIDDRGIEDTFENIHLIRQTK